MHILVTGGAGFIGSHIVDACIADGHEVTIVDNLSTGDRRNLNGRARFVELDIRDREGIARLIEEGKFDLINHHAAQLDVRVSVRDPQFDAEQNIIGTLNLLQAAVRSNVGAFVFASSGGTVYGDQIAFPATEEHPTRPVSPYGITKLSVEHYLHFYRREYGLRYAALRYTNVYGPRQNPHGEAGVVAIFIEKMLSGETPVINGDGLQTRDYVHVSDVVRANMLAGEHLLEQDAALTLNVATAGEMSVVALFEVLNEAFGGRFEERHGPAKPGEQARSVCSYERGREILGWTPKVEMREGIVGTIDFFRSRHAATT